VHFEAQKIFSMFKKALALNDFCPNVNTTKAVYRAKQVHFKENKKFILRFKTLQIGAIFATV
jgi:hypothetical protein